jgi:hypothetical protein
MLFMISLRPEAYCMSGRSAMLDIKLKRVV